MKVLMRFLNYMYMTFIFTPLAGGNGKIQMDEIAKLLLLIMICRASFLEGRSTEQMYPDIYWIMIFSAVCAIAAIKPAFQNFKKQIDDQKAPDSNP